MASRKHTAVPVADDHIEIDEQSEIDVQAEIDAAEAAAAQARERAAAARARATELRRLAEERAAESVDDSAMKDVAAQDDTAEEPADGDDPSDVTVARRGIRELFGWKGLVIAATLLVTVGSVALTTIMVVSHRQEVRDHELAARYTDAATQATDALMGIDFTTAQDDMQQILDVTTGDLRDNYQSESDTIVTNMEETKVVTQVEVVDAAVESMDDNMAVVLLAVRTQRAAADAPPDPNQLPTLWRLALTLVHEGDQIKVSNLEYL